LIFISIAAGGFIYIAVADLIPELHKTKNIKHSLIQIGIIILGIISMLVLVLFE
jgi:zinc transporter ZupT